MFNFFLLVVRSECAEQPNFVLTYVRTKVITVAMLGMVQHNKIVAYVQRNRMPVILILGLLFLECCCHAAVVEEEPRTHSSPLLLQNKGSTCLQSQRAVAYQRAAVWMIFNCLQFVAVSSCCSK